MTESEPLGAYIKRMREHAGLTLREVEARCRISNGYLSLLENSKIKEPALRVLWELAECYSVSYRDLMRRAGYPVPEPQSDLPSSVVFSGAEHLTEDERREIQGIISLKLQLRRKRRKQAEETNGK